MLFVLAILLAIEFLLLLLIARLAPSVKAADRLMWIMLAASTAALIAKLILWPTPSFPAELGPAAMVVALVIHAALVVLLHALALRLMKK